MGVLALLNHAINFLAPAIWLALLMPLASRLLMKKWCVARTLSSQVAIHFVVGSLVLGAGLVVFGRDGKMLTYLALVVLGATCQWWMQRSSKS
jgi:hypothetical protein